MQSADVWMFSYGKLVHSTRHCAAHNFVLQKANDWIYTNWIQYDGNIFFFNDTK